MINRIPRGMLWHDRETMEDLLQSPLFSALHEVFFYFEKEPMLFPMNELFILNEVGYQVTWLCFKCRKGLTPNMKQFTREVFVRTGLKDHAMTVISLVYAAVELVNFPPLEISKETKQELKKMHKDSWCRRYIDSFIRRVVKEGLVFKERFLPNQEVWENFLTALRAEDEQKIQVYVEHLAKGVDIDNSDTRKPTLSTQDLEKLSGKAIIIQVNNADININSPGNQIIHQQKNDYLKKKKVNE